MIHPSHLNDHLTRISMHAPSKSSRACCTSDVHATLRKPLLVVNFIFLLEGLCFPVVLSAFHAGRTTAWVSPFTRLKPGTRLNIFSFNLNKNDDGRDAPPEEESDFPMWVKGLKQWPLYSAQSTLLNDVSEEEEKLAREVLGEPTLKMTTQIPLANLVNVEALLMAGGDEERVEDERELALFELNQFVTKEQPKNYTAQATPLSFMANLQELGDWNSIVLNLRNSISDLTTETSSNALSSATESIFKKATSRLENLVAEVSTAVSPQTVQSLILRAGKTLSINEGAANDLVAVAIKIAKEQGVDVRDAAVRARETAKYTTDFVNMANDLLVSGYTREDTKGVVRVAAENARPLFDEFKSAAQVADGDDANAIIKAAEMGSLCGAIYEDTLMRTHNLGHSIVANGTTANVVWMVTDSIGYQENFTQKDDLSEGPFLIRTIIIRGFDASDENVDREELLVDVCTATPELFGNGILLHAGLLKIAREVYADVVKFIDATAPKHKIVITGHSIGGSLSVLLLLIAAKERGAAFVNEKILSVYTFGSPPISTLGDATQLDVLEEIENSVQTNSGQEIDSHLVRSGTVLGRFGLPNDIVFGYVQPWDPIVRLFSEIDPLYPLIGDIGEDGTTPFASGPPRTLRPITRAIVESWDGWPRFRDSFKSTVNQNYTSVGLQHILLPEPIRYISDQLVAVNVQIPPVDFVVRISAEELLPALASIFPVDVFRISFVPAAIRSFVHHFYPAYGDPVVDYADKKKRRTAEANKLLPDRDISSIAETAEKVEPTATNGKIAPTKSSSQWSPFPNDW